MRILLAAADPRFAKELSQALRRDHHVVRITKDGLMTLRELRRGNFDLLLLDAELRRLGGFALLRHLRDLRIASGIVMFLTAGQPPDGVACLTNGADDYLVKPVSLAELRARVHALGRRFARPPELILRVANLQLDLEECRARRGRRRIDLTKRQCALLRLLMREPGRVFSRKQLCERIWNQRFDPDSNKVDVFLSRLRDKIDRPPEPPMIATSRNLGFALREKASSAK